VFFLDFSFYRTTQDLSTEIGSIVEFLVIGRYKFFSKQTKLCGFLFRDDAPMRHADKHVVVPADVNKGVFTPQTTPTSLSEHLLDDIGNLVER
jgi:hypothetical protein